MLCVVTNLCSFLCLLTCCSITTRATAAWTTLVLSRQSIQLTLKMPSCLQMTPAWSTLTEEDAFITGCIHRILIFNSIINQTINTRNVLQAVWCFQIIPQWRCRRVNVISISLKWQNTWNLPGPLHVSDDIWDCICQDLHILKLHSSAVKQDIRCIKGK